MDVIDRLFPAVEKAELPFGAVVATAVLADARQVKSEFEKQVWTRGIGPASDKNRAKAIDRDPYGDFSVGRWLWCLEDMEPVDPPVPARGYQEYGGNGHPTIHESGYPGTT